MELSKSCHRPSVLASGSRVTFSAFSSRLSNHVPPVVVGISSIFSNFLVPSKEHVPVVQENLIGGKMDIRDLI